PAPVLRRGGAAPGMPAGPGGVVDEHGAGGHAAELAHELPPALDVREQAIGEDDVELAVGGAQVIEAARSEPRASVVGPGAHAVGADVVAAVHGDVVT